MADLFEQRADGCSLVRVKLAPKAAANRINGIMNDQEGRPCLKVSVTAVPEQGKANQALIALLAKEFHLAKSAITLDSGATDRHKRLIIAAPSAQLRACIAQIASCRP